MFNYYLFSLIVSISVIGILVIRFTYTFFKKIKKLRDKNSQLFFLISLISLLFYLLFKLIMFNVSPDLDLTHVSKFDGSVEYMSLVLIASLTSLFLSLFLISFILTGLSFRGVKKYEFYIMGVLLLIWFLLFLFAPIQSINFDQELGLVFVISPIANILNIPYLILFGYVLYTILKILNKSEDQIIKNKMKFFALGASIFFIGFSLDYIIIQKMFGNFGIDIYSITIGSILFYIAFLIY